MTQNIHAQLMNELITIPDLTFAEAATVIREIKERRERTIKDSIIRSLNLDSNRPYRVISYLAHVGGPGIDAPKLSDLEFETSVRYELGGNPHHFPVQVLIEQGADQKFIAAILRRILRIVEGTPSDAWTSLATQIPSWPAPVNADYDDDIPF